MNTHGTPKEPYRHHHKGIIVSHLCSVSMTGREMPTHIVSIRILTTVKTVCQIARNTGAAKQLVLIERRRPALFRWAQGQRGQMSLCQGDKTRERLKQPLPGFGFELGNGTQAKNIGSRSGSDRKIEFFFLI